MRGKESLVEMNQPYPQAHMSPDLIGVSCSPGYRAQSWYKVVTRGRTDGSRNIGGWDGGGLMEGQSRNITGTWGQVFPTTLLCNPSLLWKMAGSDWIVRVLPKDWGLPSS